MNSLAIRARLCRRMETLSPEETESSSEVLDLRGTPLVSMMQPAEHRYRHNPSTLRRLDQSRLRSIFLQRQVNAVPMIIAHECLEVPVQAAFVNTIT